LDARKKGIVTALTVAMFLAAVEGTIITIAVPTIAKDLKGFESISLIFSAYFLTSAVSTPLYGKLADLYGRKNILLIGISIFLSGSVLCGLSQSMTMLIICRAIQGAGAGSIFTIAFTIVGDIFTLKEKPKVQGTLNAVWGVASLAGPFLGGFLISALSWHWIFFINLPFGALSIFLLHKNLDEAFEKRKPQIDYAGLIVFSLAIIFFLTVFLVNGTPGLPPALFRSVFLGTSTLLLLLFYFIEKKAAEPIVPFAIFTKTTVLINLISFLLAAMLIGIDIYIPIYIQDVLGFSALISGLVLAPMSAAWLISSVVLGGSIARIGGKAVILLSNLFVLASTLLLTFLQVNSPLVLVIMFTVVIGIGFGGAYTTITIVIQSSVGYGKRGAAIAANGLFKTLGQTSGASILGSAFNFFVALYFAGIGVSGIDLGSLYASSSMPGAAVPAGQMKLALCSALDKIYLVFIAMSIICIILTLMAPHINCDDGDKASS
jgi:multidrug resistance protein